MFIRIFKFFVAFLLSFDVRHGLRWFCRISIKSNKIKPDGKELLLPLKRDWTRLSSMKKIVKLCDINILADHVSVMKNQRLSLPHSDWMNISAALMVVLAVCSITSQTFSSGDSFSWITLLVVVTCCTIQQLNAETTFFGAVQDMQLLLFRLLPFRVISRFCGRLCQIYIPSFFRPFLYKFYIQLCGVYLQDALVTDLKHYKTIEDFFCRKLKPHLRPINIQAQVLSPVDGTIVYCNTLFDGMVKHVKGINYSINKFLGPLRNSTSHLAIDKYLQSLMYNPLENDLYCCVIYLAAGDYHRFHSPTNWQMMHRRHFAGDLLSVNPYFLSWIPDLFILNERVVLSGQWRHGFFSMTPVGATNVGSIVLHDDMTLQTNIPYAVKEAFSDQKFGRNGISYLKGTELGMFKLGSTVVLIFEAPKNSGFVCKSGVKIKYGEKLMMTHFD